MRRGRRRAGRGRQALRDRERLLWPSGSSLGPRSRYFTRGQTCQQPGKRGEPGESGSPRPSLLLPVVRDDDLDRRTDLLRVRDRPGGEVLLGLEDPGEERVLLRLGLVDL